MKKASEYKNKAGKTSAIESKYSAVLKIVHENLEVAAERGIHSIDVQIPICEDDLYAFDALFLRMDIL